MFPESLVVNPGRLRILTALAESRREEFVPLRNRTRLTDGNLAAHAKRLHSGGLIDIEKQFRDGKPVTSFVLTTSGRAALEEHARQLLEAVGIAPRDFGESRVVPDPVGTGPGTARLIEQLEPIAQPSDDWID
jgi:DNA-binding MarR family transcriptional regulator